MSREEENSGAEIKNSSNGAANAISVRKRRDYFLLSTFICPRRLG